MHGPNFDPRPNPELFGGLPNQQPLDPGSSTPITRPSDEAKRDRPVSPDGQFTRPANLGGHVLHLGLPHGGDDVPKLPVAAHDPSSAGPGKPTPEETPKPYVNGGLHGAGGSEPGSGSMQEPSSSGSPTGKPEERGERPALGSSAHPEQVAPIGPGVVGVDRGPRRTPVDDFKRYGEYMAKIEEALRQPKAYEYTTNTTEPRALPDFLGYFYGRTREQQRQRHIQTLWDESLHLHNDPRTPDTVVQPCREVLSSTYELTRNMRAVYDGKATLDTRGLSGPQRLAAQRSLDTINRTPKSPVIAEYMRHSIPRFTWQAHDMPDTQIPEGYESRLRQLWSGYSSRDASLLIRDSELAEGKAPLHMAIAAARQVEADGHADLGYNLKSQTILTALHRENARLVMSSEVPFLKFIFQGAMTNSIGLAPKGAHFDYQNAVTEVMSQTWARAEKEFANGQPGSAATFLRGIADVYGEEIRPFLAASMKVGADQGLLDPVRILKGLHDAKHPLAPSLIGAVGNWPKRRMLTSQEGDVFAGILPNMPDPSSQATQEALGSLPQEADIYSFKSTVPLSRDEVVTTHVDIDTASGRIAATVTFKTNGQSRKVPLTFDQESGEVTMESIDGGALNGTAQARYKILVRNALVTEGARLRQVRAAQEKGVNLIHQGSSEPTKKAVQKQKIKTRGVPDESMIDQTVSIPPEEDQARGRTTVSGMEAEQVQKLLKAGKVKGITPVVVVDQIKSSLRAANDTRTSFGKRPVISHFKGGDKVKLRQVNWITEAGALNLRLYFVETGGGNLELCGIINKAGASQQLRDIQTIITRLLK